MRINYTLFFLLAASISFGQNNEILPAVCNKAMDIKKPDTASLAYKLTNKVSCFIPTPVKKDTVKHSTRMVLHCQRTITDDKNLPLIVVDGLPVNSTAFTYINPNDIASISILKDGNASAIYGWAGINGVIVIITKKAGSRQFIIKDFIDGSLIPGATVTLISADKKDTLHYAATDRGRVIISQLTTTGYAMKVSANGYKTFSQPLFTDRAAHTILLARVDRDCEEVPPSSLHTCKDSAFTTKNIHLAEPIKIYPNPIQQGATFDLPLTATQGGQKKVRILNAGGKEMLRQTISTGKETKTVQVQTDARWPAGIYFIQLIYENGRVAASGTIITQ